MQSIPDYIFWIWQIELYLKHQTSHKGDVRLACHLAYEIKAVKIFNATVVLEWVWIFFRQQHLKAHWPSYVWLGHNFIGVDVKT